MYEGLSGGTLSFEERDRLTFDDEITLEGMEGMRYSELWNRYADSPFGQLHATQALRYSNRYPYDPKQMLEDLGTDIHPLLHMPHTESKIFKGLVAWQDPNIKGIEHFSETDILVGRFGSLLHDIGENEHPELAEMFGGTVGDVNYWLKTDKHEEAEVQIRRFFYEALYPDVPTPIFDAIEDMITNREGSFIRDAFATTERIGYMMTSVRAGEVAARIKSQISSDADMTRFTQLNQLYTDVGHDWQADIEARGDRYPYARYLAGQYRLKISDIDERLAD